MLHDSVLPLPAPSAGAGPHIRTSTGVARAAIEGAEQ